MKSQSDATIGRAPMPQNKSEHELFLLLTAKLTLNDSGSVFSSNEEQIEQELDDEAERRGIAQWELILQLSTTSEEQLQSQLHAAHQEIAEMVEMSWEDYCRLHNLSETIEQHRTSVQAFPSFKK